MCVERVQWQRRFYLVQNMRTDQTLWQRTSHLVENMTEEWQLRRILRAHVTCSGSTQSFLEMVYANFHVLIIITVLIWISQFSNILIINDETSKVSMAKFQRQQGKTLLPWRCKSVVCCVFICDTAPKNNPHRLFRRIVWVELKNDIAIK
jgi:hypothetical protein